ncbi:hypothetical protein [Paenibacillus lactis]|uniref:hypothetical protein n=1 Tax=Paenibacillus lactis TaxID=228574 RepID=UPI001B27C735|nr:hypothetical protein [Paenibacillus lactis]MCM3491973.1 hypothetical protein [Paenibacillus lactis]GIO92193.1 hypothetical protein J31TS3_34200 [Paenibacillus lactis]
MKQIWINRSVIGMVFLSAFLSIAAGIMYLSSSWINFSFLGPEVGSETEVTSFWAGVSIVIGIGLAGTALNMVRIRGGDAPENIALFLTLCLSIIQLPPLFLWFGVWTVVANGEALWAILIHLMLMAAGSINAVLLVKIGIIPHR